MKLGHEIRWELDRGGETAYVYCETHSWGTAGPIPVVEKKLDEHTARDFASVHWDPA